MNPPIVYAETRPIAQRTSKMTAMVQSIFVTPLLGPAASHRKETVPPKLARRTVAGHLLEVLLSCLVHVDDDAANVRCIHCKESPCHP